MASGHSDVSLEETSGGELTPLLFIFTPQFLCDRLFPKACETSLPVAHDSVPDGAIRTTFRWIMSESDIGDARRGENCQHHGDESFLHGSFLYFDRFRRPSDMRIGSPSVIAI